MVVWILINSLQFSSQVSDINIYQFTEDNGGVQTQQFFQRQINSTRKKHEKLEWTEEQHGTV